MDVGFSKKLFFNNKQYNQYEKAVMSIHTEVEKIDNLEKLMNSVITEDTREKISTSMNELLTMFDD